jgi:hypothetical protein
MSAHLLAKRHGQFLNIFAEKHGMSNGQFEKRFLAQFSSVVIYARTTGFSPKTSWQKQIISRTFVFALP